MMLLGLAAALTSCAACIALTPIVRRLCLRWGAVDQPGPLKIHARPIPRLGGVAIALSISASVFIVARGATNKLPLFFAAFGLVWFAGIADDLRGLSPLVRLATQVLAGVLLWFGGWRFSIAPRFPGTGPVSMISVCVLVVLLTNSVNFLDGSDGVAAGVCAIVAAVYLAISPASLLNPMASALAGALAGSSVAFLLYNFPPANIFLGDSGSILLGFCVAFLCLSATQSTHQAPTLSLLPLILAGLPLLDAALAVMRRLKTRASPLLGDRRHFYDLLLARGWSPPRVALACYGITFALATLAWLGLHVGPRSFLLLSVFGLAGLFVLAVGLGSLRVQDAEVPAGIDLTVLPTDTRELRSNSR